MRGPTVETSLAEETFLDDDFLRQLMSVGEVDLLVGIPSHNNAKSISQTVTTIEECFQQNFVRDRVVIVNADGGSRDGTSDVVLNAPSPKSQNPRGLSSLRTLHRITTRYGNQPSQGAALRAILAAADLLRARACAIISPETANFTAAWVKSLLQPAYRENFDFVAPLYSRHKNDGLLARNLVYPMGRAVFGKRIRELNSGEFGFSGRLAGQCLNLDVWREEAVRTSPEAWMATSAISSGFRCCQSFLGPKVHSLTSSGTDIVTLVRQTVGTLFWCLESQQSFWMERTGSEPVATFGPEHELTSEPVRVNRKRIFDLFLSGAAELSEVLKTILSTETHAELQQIATQDDRTFRYQDALWVKTLYEFAASYHRAAIDRDHLVQALVPLYRGRIYSFLQEHHDSSPQDIEAHSENLCLEFERQKPYLVERWNAK
jgi:glucosylglycerate synthase